MTQLSFDAGKRVPLLDLAPVGKSARPGANQDEPFDSHLNRASAPPSSPASSTASSASSSSRPPANSSTESTSPKSSHEEGASAKQSSTDTSGQEDKATTTTSNAQETNQPHSKQSDADKEKDHQGEDDVVLSEELAVVVQQTIAVEDKTKLEVEQDSPEIVQETGESKEEEGKAGLNETQPKTRQQPNLKQATTSANYGNKQAETEAEHESAQVEEQPTEKIAEAADQFEIDLSAVHDLEEEQADESSEKKQLSANEKTTTITVKDGQTNENSVVVNKEVNAESRATDSSDDEKSEQSIDKNSTPNSSRVSNQSSNTDSTTPGGNQSREQQAALAVGNDLPPEASFDNDPANTQDGAGSEQRTDLKSSETSINKVSSVAKSGSENSSTNKQFTLSNEAPVQRAEHSASSTSSLSANESVSAADRARFVQRVYRALHVAHERGGEVRLRLSPPELGNLTLELKLHDGAMTAHIEAETSAARTLLLDNLSVLKDRLAAHDIKVEKFEVDLRNQSRQQSPDGQSQNSDEGRNLRNVLRKPYLSGAKVEEKASSPEAQLNSANGKLNVII